jgi:hypothetical protein
MKINYLTSIEDIKSINVDYFICCSGFESRSSYFFKQYKNVLESSKKVCFQFQDRKDFYWEENAQLYRNNNFVFKNADSNSAQLDDYLFIANEIFVDKKKNINVVIDFSSMTTTIYAALLKYFNMSTDKYFDVNLYFCYTPATYTPSMQTVSLSINKPISIFETIQTTDKKIALIIGLGYDKDKALGLYEYFQNNKEDMYLFIARNSENDSFYKSTVENNKDLIKMIDKENIIYYAIDNIQYLISTLESLVAYLIASNKRVVIAPTGAKQFTLISLITNLFHKEITTYRTSYGAKREAVDQQANEDSSPIITLVNFKAN